MSAFILLVPPENSCRPAVDALFRSVAEVYGGQALGPVVTGLGQVGLRRSEALRRAGGRVLAQDEATSVVWGMPGAVVGAGLAERVFPLGCDSGGTAAARHGGAGVPGGRTGRRPMSGAARVEGA